jgi:hypothetical protein
MAIIWPWGVSMVTTKSFLFWPQDDITARESRAAMVLCIGLNFGGQK